MKNIAIIFAGGSGARMGSGLPKQFIEVNGKPIIIHTLEIFEEHPAVDAIYVACKEDCISRLQKLVKRFLISKVKDIVPGGATGQDSILNGLRAACEGEGRDNIVMIHDGVRPCITAEVIDANLRSVREYGSAVTCTKLLKLLSSAIVETWWKSLRIAVHSILHRHHRAFGLEMYCRHTTRCGKTIRIMRELSILVP